MSARRLGRSILAGRLLEAEQVSVPENDKGIENHIPFVNRLVGWWARMPEKGWRDQATPEQLADIKRNLEPVIAIYNVSGRPRTTDFRLTSLVVLKVAQRVDRVRPRSALQAATAGRGSRCRAA